MHVSRKRSLFQVVVQCDVVFPWDSASAPTLARPGVNCFDTAGSCGVGSSERDRNVLDEVDGVDWPSGGYSCSRESAKEEMAARKHRPTVSLTKAYDGSVDQNGCGEQLAVWRCAVVFRLDRFVHGKRLGSHRRCSTRLECEGVATSLSGVFPEERCKVGGADDVVAEA